MLKLLLLAIASTHGAHHFAAGPNGWLLDDKPFQIRSGELHYERVPRAYWDDRLAKAKAMGLNTICSYVFWNFHEPEQGKYQFKGDHDVAAFVRAAQRHGLYVVLRPSPYCCAEWDWGGFPYWLANIPGMAVRQNNPAFLKATGTYLDRLGKELAPLTVSHGGPILMAQVENEYGSFGKDHAYMEAIRAAYRHAGFDCQLNTADGAADYMLSGGTLPDLPAAINFGGGPEGEFASLAKVRPNGPRMNGEFWCGWFDHWGEGHHTTSAAEQAQDLEWMDSRGYSFSLYMFHGGTSFGWMNGANNGGKGGFEPDTTSYDYDAPVAEDGRLTPKFWAFREVIQRHLPPGEVLPEPPAALPLISIPEIQLSESAAILDQLPSGIQSQRPLTFEALNHPFGFVLYRTHLPANASGKLTFTDLQDRALVYRNRQFIGTVERMRGEKSLELPAGAGDQLDVLVENQGRINYSHALLNEHKGFKTLSLQGNELLNWDNIPIPLGTNAHYHFMEEMSDRDAPLLLRGEFQLTALGDTYLDMRGWGKGNVWVNGHNLGRFWKIGPQQTLFLPAPYLHRGRNFIEVLDVQPTFRHKLSATTKQIFENP